jgi:hypothetical protein
LLASADRLAADANTPEFAALHLVGETYPERAQDRIRVPLPPRVLDARTPAALATDVFECPLSELIRLNAGRGWEADTVLDDGTEVHIPDSDLAPMLAARLAAEALVVPNLSATERTTIIQRLVPPALENPTALDTVLGRLLLAARPTRSEDIADITNSAIFTSHRPVP